jgi:hypothetical protein
MMTNISLPDNRIWLTYLTTLIGTTFIVLGLSILPFYIQPPDIAGLIAFLGAGLVFISSTAMYLIHNRDYIRIEPRPSDDLSIS